ncbi:hypothetical protein NMY22_g9231 [Coprinellus aureogranulatus]|nr:hypothetical protein NMY22_g9231 [Coprinellus aureogranulatus]
MIHTLDRVQDLVTLSRQREDVIADIIRHNEGFREPCRDRFNWLLQELQRVHGPPSTGILEEGTIGNYSLEDLMSLGIDFSTHPAALELDRLVAGFWEAPMASSTQA